MNERETIQGAQEGGINPDRGSPTGNVHVYDKPERETPPLGAILGIIALVALLILLIVWIF